MFLLGFGGFSNATVRAQATTPATNANWPASSFDYQNTNNDPQNVININNVQDLGVNWIYQIPVNPFSIPGAPPALGIEAQPLVSNGIVYIATPYNSVVALNAATGNLAWSSPFQVNMTKFIGEKWWAGAYVISGISEYGSTQYNNATIFVMASDTTVYALNALDGTVLWTIPPVAANILGNTGTYYGEKAPILIGDNLIVRASTTDYGGRGFVAAYNINTKNMSWIWYSTPPSSGPIDTNWDSQDMVTLANGTTVNYGQPSGNITPYPGDWGTTAQEQNLAGGGAAWGLIAVDNKTGVIYFSTGHPSDPYDASLRPGPNLYTDCIVALNTTDGKMLWYYQMTSHDITEHEGGWSVGLSTVTINGTAVQVVTQASKNNEIYVLNSATGKPVYKPIVVGPPGINNWNDGLTSNSTPAANLTASQSLFGNNQEICPGTDGGIEMAPAISGNMLYAVTQNACGEMSPAPYYYKGVTISGYLYTGDPSASQNATVYSIDLSTGQTVWHSNLPNRYQGSSAVVSGGVLYVVDRAGILYEFNQQTGTLLKTKNLGGTGASGVSIGEDSNGNMEVFAPAGGGELGGATPGILVAYSLPGGLSTTGTGSTSSTSTSSSTGQPIAGLEQPIIIVLGVVVVVLAMYVLLKRRTPTQARGTGP
ncbi:MAG: PQQ-binding-like beta-propeller repeat protein [Thaumarchaeota archaeon]|nr:PQQ-binding-like beta-propeller repeat protein [Nitrososphaerota archaeon]